MSKNIAIVGRMYAGKTTLADRLVLDHGYTRVAMAGPLKMLAKLAYGGEVQKDKVYETVDRVTGDTLPKTGREILQGIGQSLKYVDRDIWLKIFIADTEQMDRAPYVCDDVRFGFEADYLASQGWYLIKVQTPEEERILRAEQLTGRTPTARELYHESEIEVDGITVDAVTSGNAPLEYLEDTARLFAEQ